VTGIKDLHLLPQIGDGWSYLYVEHCRIDQEDLAIAVHDIRGKTPVPCASLALLMLGPGTTITHAAVKVLAEAGCLVAWTGEEGVRFYAEGLGRTRSARNLLRQARLCSDPALRLQVVMRLYRMRFGEELDPSLTLQQIRGKEGIRVREAYSHASRQTGVKWAGRSYRREDWDFSDPVNRALSCANSCLYGVCHAAIVAAGYSPALGFIHTGKMLSFVYDIADLYKTDTTVPAAFAAVAEGTVDLERRVRQGCREVFRQQRVIKRIVPDIHRALAMDSAEVVGGPDFDSDAAAPGALWDPDVGQVEGGINQADLIGGEGQVPSSS